MIISYSSISFDKVKTYFATNVVARSESTRYHKKGEF